MCLPFLCVFISVPGTGFEPVTDRRYKLRALRAAELTGLDEGAKDCVSGDPSIHVAVGIPDQVLRALASLDEMQVILALAADQHHVTCLGIAL